MKRLLCAVLFVGCQLGAIPAVSEVQRVSIDRAVDCAYRGEVEMTMGYAYAKKRAFKALEKQVVKAGGDSYVLVTESDKRPHRLTASALDCRVTRTQATDVPTATLLLGVRGEGRMRAILFEDVDACASGQLIGHILNAGETVSVAVPANGQLVIGSELYAAATSTSTTNCPAYIGFEPKAGVQYEWNVLHRPGGCRTEVHVRYHGVRFRVPIQRREPVRGFGSTCKPLPAAEPVS